MIIHILKKNQNHIPCSFTYKVVCIDDNFSKPVVLYRGENALSKFIEATLTEYNCCKKIMKKHFNKNLIMSVEDEKRFQLTHKCWICKSYLLRKIKK